MTNCTRCRKFKDIESFAKQDGDLYACCGDCRISMNEYHQKRKEKAKQHKPSLNEDTINDLLEKIDEIKTILEYYSLG